MTRIRNRTILGIATLAGCVLGAAGCRTAGTPAMHAIPASRVRLAAAEETPTSHPAATAPTSRPAPRLSYTSPSLRVQQMDLMAMVATASVSSAQPMLGDRDAAEARTISGGSVSGAAALGAPQPRTINAVVGQPGLHRGYASGFGPVPRNNLFTRNVIPLTGPGGRCDDLVRTGFFKSAADCITFFNKR